LKKKTNFPVNLYLQCIFKFIYVSIQGGKSGSWLRRKKSNWMKLRIQQDLPRLREKKWILMDP